MFYFKHFSVEDQKASMKVGTDAVLLAVWIENRFSPEKILDIGTGCGVISLILAQRMQNSIIHALDMDTESINEADENIKNSPFAHQVETRLQRFQDFWPAAPEPYSLLVSNPPFFQNSLRSGMVRKNTTRHSDRLSFVDLMEGVHHLLTPKGRFCCIIPVSEWNILEKEAESRHLFCVKKTQVYTTKEKPPQRILACFSKEQETNEITDLYIKDIKGSYSEEYLWLTRDFYLFA